ncbi:hypothetical protein DP49_971 [Burkholderia pseudomallei]|nr:hypothetical protein DP49_971 [Burkholderia pseudomallei]KGV49454.1 hypothetical protein X900_5696 [Burkholderia pseudomallei BDU 2]
MQRLKLKALRDINLTPAVRKGAVFYLPPPDALALVALGWASQVTRGRPKLRNS